MLTQVPVISLSRITPETNGKIRPQPERENGFSRESGGGSATSTKASLVIEPLKPFIRPVVRNSTRRTRNWQLTYMPDSVAIDYRVVTGYTKL